MYRLCVTEQSAQRQRQLEEGLLSAMAIHPYEDISVSDLCQQMQIPRKSFYRYFSSKDGALQALLDHTLMDTENVFQPSPRPGALSSVQVLESFFLFWKDRKALLDALARSGLSGLLIQRAIAYAMKEGMFRSHLHPNAASVPQEWITTFMVSGLMSLVIHWHHSGFASPVHDVAAAAFRLLTQPMFSATL